MACALLYHFYMNTFATLLFLTLLQLPAHASVWSELENGEHNAQTGIIRQVDPQGNEILLEILTIDAHGSPVTTRAKICTQNHPGMTEEMRAIHYKMQLDQAVESRNAKTKVQFGTKGPWDSCLSFLKPA